MNTGGDSPLPSWLPWGRHGDKMPGSTEVSGSRKALRFLIPASILPAPPRPPALSTPHTAARLVGHVDTHQGCSAAKTLQRLSVALRIPSQLRPKQDPQLGPPPPLWPHLLWLFPLVHPIWPHRPLTALPRKNPSHLRMSTLMGPSTSGMFF